MSSASSKEPERFDLVSSFYGPGATIGWYLTALSCVVLFGLHPRKRKADNITVDLIATLIFPSVAAGDLISHVHFYSRAEASAPGVTSEQRSACIEASLLVIESFLAIDVMLFLLAVGFKRIRRGCLLASIGLFCFAAECCVPFSPHVEKTLHEHLDRSFLDTFKTIPITVSALLYNLSVFGVLLIVHHLEMPLPADELRELARRIVKKQKPTESYMIRLSVLTNMLTLSVCFLVTVWPLISSVFTSSPPQLIQWLHATSSQPTRTLVPKSNISLKELDQAVALLTGATVLGFSLYSVANSHLKAWLLRTEERQQRRENELRRRLERQIELVRFGQVRRRSS